MENGYPIFLCQIGESKMTMQLRVGKGTLIQTFSFSDIPSVTYRALPTAKVTIDGKPIVNGTFTKSVTTTDNSLSFAVEITP
jgi:hypothetical protein